ncbi:AtpZ/AtpI family protein [Flavicella marina]|uniref:AtpZ/AtpI family protein n=1 Tax=Flavicella marina TaxID=1475951 RepID=UPI0012654624
MALKKPQNKQLNKFVRFIGIGIQLGATMYIAAYLGKKLDAYFGFEKTLTLICILFAFVMTMYSILLQLKNIQDD